MSNETTRESAIDQAIVDYLERLDEGQDVNLSEFLQQNSGLSDSLREFMTNAEVVEQLAAAAAQSGVRVRDTAASLGQITTCPDDENLWPPVRSSLPVRSLTQLGRYHIVRRLGEGAMGAVYLAHDEWLDREVALKIPQFAGGGASATVERFYREARAAARVRHRNLCPVFDVGEIDGVHYLSMAYIQGTTLTERLRTSGCLRSRQALQIVSDVASGLAEAHRQGIVHRDLKPSNIMIDLCGSAIVTDFGLARQVDDDDTQMTQSGMLVGSPAYMSPEQVDGRLNEIGPHSDIYALGVILYQLLTGRLPYEGSLVSVITQIMTATPVPPSECHPRRPELQLVDDLCLRMMARELPRRPASMDSLREEITQLTAVKPEASPPPVPPPIIAAPAKVRTDDEYSVSDSAPVPAITPFGSSNHENENETGARRLERLKLKAQTFASRIHISRKGILGLGASAVMVTVIAILTAIFSSPQNLTPGATGRTKAEREGQEHPVAKSSLPTPGPGTAEGIRAAPGSHGQELQGQPNQPKATDDPAPSSSDSTSDTVDGTKPMPAETDIEIPPAVPPPVKPKDTDQPQWSVACFEGQPFGVARLTIQYEKDQRPRIFPDQVLSIVPSQGRVLYPTWQITWSPPEAGDQRNSQDYQVEQLTAYCLTAGDQGTTCRVYVDDDPLSQSITLSPLADIPQHRDLIDDWWTAYVTPPIEPMGEHEVEMRNFLYRMLARRLNLPLPEKPAAISDDVSALEKYFERVVTALLGFDSVDAGFVDTWAEQPPAGTAESSLVPIPAPLRIRPVEAPPIRVTPTIEPIAGHVPYECFYVRCRTVDNYLWFRRLLLNWGGSLDEVVSTRSHDHRIRQTLERQLGIHADERAGQVLSGAISDLALIGTDPYFEAGAGVGVLFEARDATVLQRWISEQHTLVKADWKDGTPGPIVQQVQLGGWQAVQFASADRRVLSYYVVHGQYHLVTNCRTLALRFLQCHSNRTALANLKEFQYARSQYALQQNHAAFVYLSDPFFRQLASPRYRIEGMRRAHAIHEIRQAQLARLAAANEHRTIREIDDLVDAGFLPAGFGQRVDHSRPVIKGTQILDSFRGIPGTFLPIADIGVEQVTVAEAEAYQRFESEYRRQWEFVDPVAVAITHRSGATEHELVGIQIKVTPYARERYASLEQWLSQQDRQRVATHADDLLSLDAGLKTGSGLPFRVYSGLRDAAVQFEWIDGDVHLSDNSFMDSWAGSHTYFALSHSGREVFQTLSTLTRDLQITGQSIKVPIDVDINGLMRGVLRIPIAVINRWLGVNVTLPGPAPKRDEAPREGWVIFGRSEIRGETTDQMRIGSATDLANVRVRMANVRGARVEPYVQAYTYRQLRGASTLNARLLDSMYAQLGVEPHDAQLAVRDAFGVALFCPLEGQLSFEGEPYQGGAWGSNAWTFRSIHELNGVPDDYRFPFLDWLHGLDVRFTLDRSSRTLDANVQLEVSPLD